jgi:hypothetical protein
MELGEAELEAAALLEEVAVEEMGAEEAELDEVFVPPQEARTMSEIAMR